MSDHDVDADFDAGFAAEPMELTETPDSTGADAIAAEESQQLEGQQNKGKEADQPSTPEYRQITTAEYDQLMAKATELDGFRNESKTQFDKAFGQLGGMKQVIEKLQANTRSGQQVSLTEDDFKELKDEGYGDIAQMTAAGFNRALERAGVLGTGNATQAGISAEQVKEIFSQGVNPLRDNLRSELKDSIREDMAKEALSEMHEGWEQLVNTPDFAEWRKANKIDELKDRSGKSFAESLNPAFVGKVISDFKASKKQSAIRQNRLEAAVAPRGNGGVGTGQSNDEDDDFNAGFNGR